MLRWDAIPGLHAVERGLRVGGLRPKATIPLLALIATSLALIVFNGSILLDRVGTIQDADVDNRTWLMAQLEVDHKELRIALLAALLEPEPSLSADVAVRRAFDIYFSRLLTVSAALEPMRGTAFRDESLTVLDASRDQMAALIDGAARLASQDIQQLISMTSDDLDDIRHVASGSLMAFVQLAKEQRLEHRDLLIRLELLMGLLIVLMTVAVFLALRISQEATARALNAARIAAGLRRTFEASLDGVLVSDAAGAILFLNKAARCMFGPVDRLNLRDLVVDATPPPDSDDATLKTLVQSGSQDQTTLMRTGRHRFTGLNHSGRQFPIEVSMASDHDIEGRPVAIAFLRDITEDVLAEARLREAHDQAKRDADAKSRFLAVMSHEMRTPLHGVLAALDLIDTAGLTRTDVGFLETARACGLSALDQVDEVLELTRSGATEVTLTAFDPRRLVAELLVGLRPLAAERGNRLVLQSVQGGSCKPIFGWFRGFQLVLRNLISNAVKYTRDGEILVSIECSELPDGLLALDVEVQDTGVGIDPADHERIFLEFETVDKGERDGAAGVGLGLAIARTAVERMGGKLRLESARGAGSRFSFRLALEPAPDVPHPVRRLPVTESPKAAVPRRILVVDDNPVNLALMSEMLRRLGHVPDTAPDGLAAVSLAQVVEFDLILMDIGMPGLDGLQTTRAIRSGGASAFVPVVGVTALTPNDDRQRILDAGMQDVLGKPLRLEPLRAYLEIFFEDHLPAIDPSDTFAEARDLMGDVTMALLVEEVLRDAGSALAALRALHPRADHGPLRHALHRTAGSAAVIGATALADALLDGERAALSGDHAALRRCEGVIATALQATVERIATSWPELDIHVATAVQA